PTEIGPVFQPKLIWIGLERPIRNAEEVHSVYTFFSCTRCEEEIFSLKQWIAHATLKGPSVVKEIIIGTVLGLGAASFWKMHHWNEKKKIRTFYDFLEKGEISVVKEEE
ncbi:hypothetical protein PHAVU_001G213100, partial [Phaseolus vulgaris]